VKVMVAGIVAGLGLAATFGRRVLDIVEVEGRSMVPALLPGDRLLVEALTYRSRSPRVGEVVLAVDPRMPSRELIKRIAAVDGAAGTATLVGDAPGASTDSRAFGPVPLAAIRWRVAGRYWPAIGRSRPSDARTGFPSDAETKNVSRPSARIRLRWPWEER
jgi:nickel-type superoxide dismutase maturation protease